MTDQVSHSGSNEPQRIGDLLIEHTALTEDGAPVTKDQSGKSHINNPIRFTQEPAKPSFDLPKFGQHTDALKS